MFDPLHKWLGIPPSEQPPNDYRLLGIATFEDDPEVIDSAADRDLTFLHDLTNGEHGDLAEELSNRISAARLRLLNKKKKAAYDLELRQQEEQSQKTRSQGPGNQGAAAPYQPGDSATVLGMPPGVTLTPPVTQQASVAQPAADSNASLDPPLTHDSVPSPPSQPSTRQRAPQPAGPVVYERSTSGTRRRGGKLIWLFGVAPGLIILGYLLFSIWIGELELDQNKLEKLGVPAEQAEQLAGGGNNSNENNGGSATSNQPTTNGQATTKPNRSQSRNNQGSRPQTAANGNTATGSRENGSPSRRPPGSGSSTTVARPPEKKVTSPATTPPKPPNLAEYWNPPAKPSLPSADAIANKMQTVRDLYQKAYREATRPEEKLDVAKQMLSDAQSTQDDPVGQVALFRVAREIFVLEGDYKSAIAIVDDLDDSFADVNPFRLKADVLREIDKTAPIAVEYSNVVLELAAEALNLGRIDEGLAFCTLLRDKVKRIPLRELAYLKNAEQQLGEAKLLLDEYEKHALILEKNPTDPAAKTAAGKYFCLVENRWDDGLPMLAGGDAPKYKAAASSELNLAKPDVSELDVADAWFELVESTKPGFVQRSLADHAKSLYQTARSNTSGLEIRKIDMRLVLLNAKATQGPLNSARLGAEKKRSEMTKARIAAKAQKLAEQPKVLKNLTWDSTAYTTDFAIIRGNTLQVGMGNRSSGYGEAAAGVEFMNVGTIGVQGVASHALMYTSSSMSKTGFLIDYHTPTGYTKRVFLNCDANAPTSFSSNPPWGTARAPIQRERLPRNTHYTISLEKWAPTDWDGQCWFSVYMQNAGMNRLVTATLTWQARSANTNVE